MMGENEEVEPREGRDASRESAVMGSVLHDEHTVPRRVARRVDQAATLGN